MCDTGGVCRNVQWRGYVCDNEFIVRVDPVTGDITLFESDGKDSVDLEDIELKHGVTYRFTILDDVMVSVHASPDVGAPAIPQPGNECGCARNGPLLLTIDDETPGPVYLRSKVYLRSNAGGSSSAVELSVEQHSVSAVPELEMLMKDSATLADEPSFTDDTSAGSILHTSRMAVAATLLLPLFYRAFFS